MLIFVSRSCRHDLHVVYRAEYLRHHLRATKLNPSTFCVCDYHHWIRWTRTQLKQSHRCLLHLIELLSLVCRQPNVCVTANVVHVHVAARQQSVIPICTCACTCACMWDVVPYLKWWDAFDVFQSTKAKLRCCVLQSLSSHHGIACSCHRPLDENLPAATSATLHCSFDAPLQPAMRTTR